MKSKLLTVGMLAALSFTDLFAALQFSSEAKIDVYKAGVRATTIAGNLDLATSSDRILSFNVIWGTGGATLTGSLLKSGWEKTLLVGVSSGGVASRTTTDSLLFEVKLVPVDPGVAIVIVEWSRSDSLTAAKQSGRTIIGTIAKTAPNEIAPVGDGANLGSVTIPSGPTGRSGGFAGSGAVTGTGPGHMQQVIFHGQWSYIAENGDFVTVGWIAYGYIWVSDSNMANRTTK